MIFFINLFIFDFLIYTNFFYFFVDWLTAEISTVNFLEITVTFYLLTEIFTTSLSSLMINPNKRDSLKAPTGEVKIVEINLP